MKIAILSSNKKTDLATLQSISKNSLSDLQSAYVESNSTGYTYWASALDGDFQPNDGGGFWRRDDESAKRRVFYVVADNYNFETNNATNITSPVTLEFCFKTRLLDYGVFRQSLKTFVSGVGFPNLSNSDKKIASKHYVVSKTDRESVLTTEELKMASQDVYLNSIDNENKKTYENVGAVILDYAPSDVDGFVANPSTSAPDLNVFEERIFGGANLTKVIKWSSPLKVRKIEEEILYYSNGVLDNLQTITYNADGTVKSTTTETLSYNGNKISAITRSKQ